MEEDLQNFYCLLKELGADELQRQGSYREGRLQSFHSSIATLKSHHLIELSNVLFEELVRQSENLHTLLRGPLDRVSVLDSKVQFSKGFIFLLRCCLMMLQFLEFDMSLVWEKCGVLFKILGKLFTKNLALNSYGCSVVSARNSFSQCCFLGGNNEEADQLLSFFPSILEQVELTLELSAATNRSQDMHKPSPGLRLMPPRSPPAHGSRELSPSP